MSTVLAVAATLTASIAVPALLVQVGALDAVGRELSPPAPSAAQIVVATQPSHPVVVRHRTAHAAKASVAVPATNLGARGAPTTARRSHSRPAVGTPIAVTTTTPAPTTTTPTPTTTTPTPATPSPTTTTPAPTTTTPTPTPTTPTPAPTTPTTTTPVVTVPPLTVPPASVPPVTPPSVVTDPRLNIDLFQTVTTTVAIALKVPITPSAATTTTTTSSATWGTPPPRFGRNARP